MHVSRFSFTKSAVSLSQLIQHISQNKFAVPDIIERVYSIFDSGLQIICNRITDWDFISYWVIDNCGKDGPGGIYLRYIAF